MICIMAKKSKDEINKDEVVLTPGGYRPKSSVKHVGPNQTIRRMEDGNYAAVDRERLPNDKIKSKNKTRSEAWFFLNDEQKSA